MKQTSYLLALYYTLDILSLSVCTAGYSNNCEGVNGEMQDAVTNNNPEGVKASLAKGADANATCFEHYSPALHTAVEQGYLQVVEVFLKNGCQ